MSGNDQETDEKLLGGRVGWVDIASWSGLELAGADRVRFLNGLVTCDVKALAPGSGAYGFFTTAQGKVLADAVVLAGADSLWVQVAPAMVEELRAHVEKYLIADRVTIAKREDLAAVRVIGAAAELVLSLLIPDAALPAAPWSHLESGRNGTAVRVVRHDRLGAAAVALVVPAGAAEALLAEVLEIGAALGLRAAEPEALERLRIEAGIARFGVDFGRENFPQETGAEAEAVSYTKGCYLGQEVVARIHYRGGVNRGLRGLRFETGAPPARGTELSADGHPVGRVTSSTALPSGALGLSVLHKRGWEIGRRLELGGGGAAVVTAPGQPERLDASGENDQEMAPEPVTQPPAGS